jgi:hypothetical protein
VAVATGAAAATALLVSAPDRIPPRIRHALDRPNYRGHPANLFAGPVVAGVAAVSAGLGVRDARLGRAALFVGLAGGLLGAYDDLLSGSADGRADRGLAGHLRALAERRITTGLVKLVGLGTAGILAAPAVAAKPVDRAVTAGVIAGTANLINLLDLRPGRALKAVLLLSAPSLRCGPGGDLIAGPVAAATAALPADLAERVSFDVADAARLAYGDGAFELVALLNMIPFFDELARVTASGGTLVIAFSRGAGTPIYVAPERLRADLERHGFEDVREVVSGPGVAVVARRRES